MKISFRAMPRTYEEGLQAWLEVENNGEKETFGPYDPQEQTFSGEITTALTDDIKVYIVFENDGHKLKSSVANPVVVTMEQTWNAAERNV